MIRLLGIVRLTINSQVLVPLIFNSEVRVLIAIHSMVVVDATLVAILKRSVS